MKVLLILLFRFLMTSRWNWPLPFISTGSLPSAFELSLFMNSLWNTWTVLSRA